MKNLIAIKILIISLLAFSCLFAQQNNEEDRVRTQLIRLKIKIDQLENYAARYGDNRAVSIINQAKNAFEQGSSELQLWLNLNFREKYNAEGRAKLQQIKNLFKLANELADRAARILFLKPTLNLINELESILRKAEEIVAETQSTQLQYFLNKARNFKRLADNEFENKRFLRGNEYLKASRYFADRIISFSNNEDGFQSSFEDYLQSIQYLFNQAGQLIDENNRQVRDLFLSARSFFEKAKASFNRGQLNLAKNNLQVVERLLYRIIDIAEGENLSESDKILNDLQSLKRYINSIKIELYRDNKSENRFLKKAEQFLQAADFAFNQSDLKKASLNINLAQRMALKAYRDLSDDNSYSQQNLKNRITELRNLLNQQSNRLDQGKGPDYIVELHKRAFNFLNKAEQSLSSSPAHSENNLNLALRFANRAEKLLQEEERDKVDENQLLTELSRLENILQRLRSNNELSQNDIIRIDELLKLLEDAGNEINRDNLQLAAEIIRIIQNQIAVILN